MIAALPATAPAKPARARKVLVLGNARGYVHSSIPLAAKTIEELGKKTGAWTTTITYDPADINTKNLEQYDALFLSNTTGCFLDAKTTEPPASKEEVEARQAALLGFVRGGKGARGHSRHRRLVSQHVRERSRLRRRARRRWPGRQPQRRRRYARIGHPALVLGCEREEAAGERPDAHEGRPVGRERCDVRPARYGEGRQGVAGQLHDAHRAPGDPDEPDTSARRAATTAAARGSTGTT